MGIMKKEKKQSRKGISIAVRLLVRVFSLLFIACVSLIFCSYYQSSKIISENIEDELVNRASENAQLFSDRLMHYQSEIETLGRREAITSMDWTIQEPIIVKEAERMGFSGIQISDVNGDTNLPGSDPFNLADKDNFKVALGGQSNITPPLFNEADQQLIIVITAPIINDADQVVGVIGGIITAEEMNNIVQSIQVGENGYAYVLDSAGTRIADKDLSVVEQQRVDVEEYKSQKGYEAYVDVQSKMINGEQGYSDYKFEGKDYYVAYTSIPETTWSLALALPESEAMGELNNLRSFMIIMTVAFLIAGAIATWIISFSIKRPLAKIKDFATQIADGNTTYRIEEKRRDEFGETCTALNQASENMNLLLKNIIDNSGNVSAAGEELTATTEEITSRLETINSAAADVVACNETNKDSVENMSESVNEITDNMSKLEQSATNQRKMSSEFKERAVTAQRTADDAIRETREIYQLQHANILESIESGKVVNEIKAMADVISDISGQINLLSLNASIEAARAGDAGRGFAVVAGEIGSLANQTRTSVDSIKNTIVKVESAIASFTDNSQSLLQFIDEKVQPQFDDYLSLGAQYFKDSNAVQMTSEALDAMVDDLQRTIKEVNIAIDSVSATTRESLNNTSEIQDALGSCTKAMNDTVSATESLASLSLELSNAATQFRV